MRLLRGTYLLLTVPLAVLLTGCGSTSISSPTTSSAATSNSGLTGNWLIAGTFPEAPGLAGGLSVSINQTGTTLAGTSSKSQACDGFSNPQIFGGADALTGLVTNGTFTLGAINSSTGGLQITGSMPAANASTWSGTYTLSDPQSCPNTPPLTGSFTATKIAPVTGTFTGSGLAGKPSQPLINPLSLTMTLQQGGTLYTNPAVTSNLALAGTLQVQGVPCFTHGSTLTTPGKSWSEMIGSSAAVSFLMDDGSTVGFDGYVADSESSSIVVTGFQISGGSCQGGQVFSTPILLKK